MCVHVDDVDVVDVGGDGDVAGSRGATIKERTMMTAVWTW